jgi:hypothetical protein
MAQLETGCWGCLMFGRLSSLFFLVGVALPSIQAAETLRESSVSGVLVPEGFDAVVVASGPELFGRLAVEQTGNILVSVHNVQESRAEVVRFSPSGQVLARSNPLADPDGLALDSSGRIFVTEQNGVPCCASITLVGSLDGGEDHVFARLGESNVSVRP